MENTSSYDHSETAATGIIVIGIIDIIAMIGIIAFLWMADFRF
jgi:hypothetical protein